MGMVQERQVAQDVSAALMESLTRRGSMQVPDWDDLRDRALAMLKLDGCPIKESQNQAS
jgi:hypothetical protein